MNETKRIIVMSGLPGSGKTTLGRELADIFRFEFLDKDDILESLLSKHVDFNTDLRSRLSREADVIFRDQAVKAGNAILTSFWRHPTNKSTAGTPSDWLPSITKDIVEVYCHCYVETAVERFLNRKRHPGHMDHLRDRAMLKTQFENLCGSWPLGFGDLIEIDTTKPINAEEVFQAISEKWAAN